MGSSLAVGFHIYPADDHRTVFIQGTDILNVPEECFPLYRQTVLII